MKRLFILVCAVFLFTSSNAQWTNKSVCVDGSGNAIKCWTVTITNNLDCDLDFFWDYSCHQCGDVEPADGSNSPNGANYVDRVSASPDNVQTLYAYEMEWDCGDNQHVDCTCPCKFKFRVGSPDIAVSDPFVAEPWPALSSWSSLGTTTYNTLLMCNGQKIQIVLSVSGSTATMTFNYW